ncbi:MAG: hypothetical protein A3F16_07625 [Deltaproteobacteria bacterium RIFCSPHIGHO2_12_FULL_43_9]|nr:MAG: hypothetical protein A3F16_07625 [Deltaproteobacteria bacterium RIFCSPHIGHO2_12_FULL_43_9]
MFDRLKLILIILLSLPAYSFAIPVKNDGCVLVHPNAPKDRVAEYLRESALADLKPTIFNADILGGATLVPNARVLKYELKTVDNILVLLVEFADAEGVGPLHNQLEQPLPDLNNTDYWVPDFSSRHYQHLLFTRTSGVVSMSNWYLEQSSGRYTVDGVVKGWYRLPTAEKEYGADDPAREGHDNLNGAVWRIIPDLLAVIGNDVDWKAFDKKDRYDYDNDGDLNEPDGYVDYLMVIHAGTGQEGGGGAQGDDALWSHRSQVNFLPEGGTERLGPAQFAKRGGVKTASPDDIWVLDYTLEPEDGGVGVFAHEFGHDLGLPDLYDTQPVGKESESSTGFWTVMSSGSWTGPQGGPLGTIPTHFGAWEKEELGWLDREEISVSGGPFEYLVQLDRVEHRGLKPQALRINLPNATETVKVVDPVHLKGVVYSAKGDDLDNSLTRKLDLKGHSAATLIFQTNYEIEADYDYAYVEVQDESGIFRSISGSITTDTNPNGSNLGHGITGDSSGWVEATFDLSQFAGKEIVFRFRYVTDGAAQGRGFVVDNLRVLAGDNTILEDSFEDVSLEGWTAEGFRMLVDGEYIVDYKRYYLVEWRTHYGFDKALSSVYNMRVSQSGAGPVWADFFSHEPGLLIWYRNEKYLSGDNHVGAHPGEGFLLIVDSHPDSLLDSKGKPLRTRVQLRDAAFNFDDLSQFSLFDPNGVPISVGEGRGNNSFNDAISYYREEDPDNSVKLPTIGLHVAIENVSFDGSAVQLRVSSDYQ